MDDPQELKSLDDLFRKTFEDLPSDPAPSGWDQPSPRVWEQVSTQIQTPRSGWTGKSILLMSGMAIILMLGLYWALTQANMPTETPAKEQPTTPAATLETPAPASASETLAQSKEQQQAVRNSSGQQVAQTTTEKDELSVNSTQREAKEQLQRRLEGSAPLPGSTPASPNTTVRRQMEAWRSAPWAQPLAPLPNILDSRFIRPVPEGLKNLGN